MRPLQVAAAALLSGTLLVLGNAAADTRDAGVDAPEGWPVTDDLVVTRYELCLEDQVYALEARLGPPTLRCMQRDRAGLSTPLMRASGDAWLALRDAIGDVEYCSSPPCYKAGLGVVMTALDILWCPEKASGQLEALRRCESVAPVRERVRLP
ncbi:MAG: hypothetical protein H6709_10235 [Kofleriaceae bacterium]|nr:hypothetical protein [Kofleriaceae bacterium]MCB9572453.1 hypothetical protein [Kofleriaceae bacterium]